MQLYPGLGRGGEDQKYCSEVLLLLGGLQQAQLAGFGHGFGATLGL